MASIPSGKAKTLTKEAKAPGDTTLVSPVSKDPSCSLPKKEERTPGQDVKSTENLRASSESVVSNNTASSQKDSNEAKDHGKESNGSGAPDTDEVKGIDRPALPEELTLKGLLEQPVEEPEKPRKIPVQQGLDSYKPANAAVPRKRPPLPPPALEGRPLVLATHLVPSLSIGLFEILADAIEAATNKPVVIVYEPRTDRPVAKDVVDIAVLPPNENWPDGELLPVSFVFNHLLNVDKVPGVYVDVIVAADQAAHVENIVDLRGHRCALPDRRKATGAAMLLFSYLRNKGESPAFFGNTLDTSSHLETLQMVAGKQVEVGVLAAPVVNCHKNTLPGVNTLYVLSSLGPLPPYSIMMNKALSGTIREKVINYLLSVEKDEDWSERLSAYGISGFAEYSPDLYKLDDTNVATSVRYY
ncbi:uncharacterized protein LOC107268803 [Cephus cinctus]|uniref:Uncharacterized protein LOC107268803 n=1 Tax=Cephus cinctus TaxID=211228 RepID=A0AAJ7FLA7_CEPCN|nr:uncharacterized protein LOC107268803 [Cephus cinctus]XP_024941835.1 uncharacterized protein LOC107268803 [Cephus cinctus]XP_024941836.1 uncharacterized protein LOC107268803 [Cephus cinctus]